MIFSLMKKDYPIIGLNINEEGKIQNISKNTKYGEYLPLAYRNDTKGLQKWWNERSTPSTQGFIEKILKEQGLSCPSEYLMNNLGLSLTDHYWIKPVDSNLTWKSVNLFENDFKNEILFQHTETPNKTLSYSPNSSLQGNLEKSWNILNGERVLIKGNHDERSIEAINEVIASKLHQMQKYENYTEYKLLKVHDKEYTYGCYSKLFTSNELELVSAHELLSSEKQPNDLSSYEFLIKLAVSHGMREETVRSQLEYQIMTDFILTNTDRHMNNIAFLMDENNDLISMAPVFDTGKSLFVDQYDIGDTKGLLSIKINSFKKNEIDMLKYIENKDIVDLTKIPDAKYIRKMYEKDGKIEKRYIDRVCDAYEKKVDICRDFQLGKDLNQVRIAIRKHEYEDRENSNRLAPRL